MADPARCAPMEHEETRLLCTLRAIACMRGKITVAIIRPTRNCMRNVTNSPACQWESLRPAGAINRPCPPPVDTLTYSRPVPRPLSHQHDCSIRFVMRPGLPCALKRCRVNVTAHRFDYTTIITHICIDNVCLQCVQLLVVRSDADLRDRRRWLQDDQVVSLLGGFRERQRLTHGRRSCEPNQVSIRNTDSNIIIVSYKYYYIIVLAHSFSRKHLRICSTCQANAAAPATAAEQAFDSQRARPQTKIATRGTSLTPFGWRTTRSGGTWGDSRKKFTARRRLPRLSRGPPSIRAAEGR